MSGRYVMGMTERVRQIADADRKISTVYDMLDEQDATNRDAKGLPFTVRAAPPCRLQIGGAPSDAEPDADLHRVVGRSARCSSSTRRRSSV